MENLVGRDSLISQAKTLLSWIWTSSPLGLSIFLESIRLYFINLHVIDNKNWNAIGRSPVKPLFRALR